MREEQWKLEEINELLLRSRIVSRSDQGGIVFRGVETDSRKVNEGDLFICLPGTTMDGHEFAAIAVEQGAVALVVTRELPLAVPQLLVPDCREAQAWIANYCYQSPSKEMRVIGVTGTNGKTTTTYLLEHLLQHSGKETGLMGTIRISYAGKTETAVNTTMDALSLQRTLREMKSAGCSHVAMEVSSHGLALGRVKGVRFSTAVFTNLTQDHLDFHVTMDDYRDSKALLFARMDNSLGANMQEVQTAVLNADDPATVTFARLTSAQVLTYGVKDATAHLRAVNISYHLGGTTFTLTSYLGDRLVNTKMFGLFNVYNVLAALATGLAERLDLDEMIAGLDSVNGVDGRFEPVRAGQPFLAVVDYAHTPDGLENVLQTARTLTEGRVICLFGCGGDRDRTKRPKMARIACQWSDVVIATSDNPRSEDPEMILDDVFTGIVYAPQEGALAKQVERIADRAEAIERAISLAEAGDVVLIAGKGHETYQIIKGVTHSFDDRVQARRALHKRGFEEANA